jgi:hypothetical protein
MNRFKFAILVAAVGMAGCFGTTHLYYSDASLQNAARATATVETHNWVLGLIDGQGQNMGGVCGMKGVATVDVEHTIGDWLFFALTVGIYNRTTVTFSCN